MFEVDKCITDTALLLRNLQAVRQQSYHCDTHSLGYSYPRLKESICNVFQHLQEVTFQEGRSDEPFIDEKALCYVFKLLPKESHETKN